MTLFSGIKELLTMLTEPPSGLPLHWTRFVGHLLVNAGDHAMAD